MEIKSYKELIVWNKSMDLVVMVYDFTSDFPKSELFNITSQIKRCVVSIPSNIAEGRRRGSRKEYLQFLRIAFGSGAELETQIEIIKRLKFGDYEKLKLIDNLLAEVMKMLNKSISTLTTTP